MDSLVLKGILFTLAAYGLPLLLGWWLFLSRAPRSEAQIRPATGPAVTMASLLGLSGASMWIGGCWDVVQHERTGLVPAGADFLWPPHLMIYASFLAALLVAVWGVAHLVRAGRRAGIGDPRLWVRQSPHFGAVMVAAFYALLSVPGDAIWHELFGQDLTAWSPPHVMLGLTSTAVVVAAAALLHSVRGAVARPDLADLGVAAMLGVALNLALLVGVAEWEMVRRLSDLVAARPLWLYPLVYVCLGLPACLLGQALLPVRYGATVVALTALALRLGMTAGFGVGGSPMPSFPLLLLGGALAIDLLPWRRAAGVERYLGLSVAFTVGFTLLSLPVLSQQPHLPPFTFQDGAILLLVGTGAGALLGALALRLGRWVQAW